MIFDYDQPKATIVYEKYLTDIVTPKIPTNAKVIIHGYTDIIGDENYNQKMSTARAKDVADIIKNALSKAGRSDVKFEIIGFGEDEKLAQFERFSLLLSSSMDVIYSIHNI